MRCETKTLDATGLEARKSGQRPRWTNCPNEGFAVWDALRQKTFYYCHDCEDVCRKLGFIRSR